MSRANPPPEPVEPPAGVRGHPAEANAVSFYDIAEMLAAQAEQTRPLRRFLYRKAGLSRRRNVLDAGCGTGVITAEIASLTGGKVRGIDCDKAMLAGAESAGPGIEFERADVRALPFEDGSFDLVTFHFFLMWVSEPEAAMAEMVRVLAPGGALVACAEPDYGGRVEYPENPEFSLTMDAALVMQGADPCMGRRLGELFRSAGLPGELGVSATLWEAERLAADFDARRRVFERDLRMILDSEQAAAALDLERAQRDSGKMLMVPLFWALGKK